MITWSAALDGTSLFWRRGRGAPRRTEGPFANLQAVNTFPRIGRPKKGAMKRALSILGVIGVTALITYLAITRNRRRTAPHDWSGL